MRIKFKGEDLGEFNGQPRIQEARIIKRELGMLPMDFGMALNNGDPDALSMMVSIMMNRNNRPIHWDDVEGEYDDFDTELTPEEQAEVDEAMKRAGQDPVGKAGRNGLRVVDNAGSTAPEKDNPTLTWTGPSPATPSDSGDTSDSPS